METDIKIPENKLPYAKEVSIMKRLDNWLNQQMKVIKETKEKRVKDVR